MMTPIKPSIHQSDDTDSTLVRRALAGDRMASGRLMERHRRSILALAYRTLGSADDAQDVAQEALVYALQQLPDLRDAGKFASWLRNITLSLCADYRRRRGTRQLGEPMTVLNERSEEVHYAEAFTIRQAVSGLSEPHRTTLLLHYVGGWSREEVAAILDIPLNTVRSRLMTAKRCLRADLTGFFPEPIRAVTAKGKLMSADTITRSHAQLSRTQLSHTQLALLDAAFPNARLLSVQNDLEPWMPFGPRVCLAFPDGLEKTLDFRGDIDPARAELLPVLERLGVPGPRLVHGPVADGAGHLTLCEVPRGENLLLWALGGTPHRIRLATERAFEAIDTLQGLTGALQADPLGATLESRTLADEVAILTEDDRWNADPWLAEAGAERRAWLQDPWFAAALAKVKAAIADIHAPLVYTHYGHFFPLSYRITAAEPFDAPFGAPGDPAYAKNPLAEFVSPFGHYGDPLLGLAMIWIYDCYPFVHTGFVEQFLWRRGVTRREFAPRLALKALQIIARDLPHTRPEDSGYWDGLRGWAEQGLGWM